jgi:hypothetical protein
MLSIKRPPRPHASEAIFGAEIDRAAPVPSGPTEVRRRVRGPALEICGCWLGYSCHQLVLWVVSARGSSDQCRAALGWTDAAGGAGSDADNIHQRGNAGAQATSS